MTLEKFATDSELSAFHDVQEQYISRNIQLADAKASLTMLTTSGAIAFLLREESFRQHITTTIAMIPSDLSLAAPVLWPAAAASFSLALLAISAGLSFLVIAPRMPPPAASSETTGARGVVFWGDIASFPLSGKTSSYVEAVRSRTLTQIANEKLANIYALSRVCLSKMRVLRAAMFFGAVGFLTMFAWELIEPK